MIRMMRENSSFWDYAIFFLCFALLIYGEVRAQYPMRWSGWALGDARVMNSANHFAREGFGKNYFLPVQGIMAAGEKYRRWHDNKADSSDFNATSVGFYTRYPPLSNIWAGFWVKYGDFIRESVQHCIVLFDPQRFTWWVTVGFIWEPVFLVRYFYSRKEAR
jgi:hypothetical protein